MSRAGRGIVHVVGAGLAGLSAAVRLAGAGERVILHEAAPQAGGRCRSYRDPTLGLEIDNGNHLLLSGNHAARAYLALTGAPDGLTGPGEARFPFLDLKTGESWVLAPNDGRVPWWVFSHRRRVPGSRATDYFAPAGILFPGRDRRIDSVMRCEGLLYDRLWGPILLAALNTEPAAGSTRLAAALMRETLLAGGEACRPLIAARGLSAAFVDPALRFLAGFGGAVRFGRRLRAITRTDRRASALVFQDGEEALGMDDGVVLAVPPWIARDLLPELVVPDAFQAIVNAHFACPPPVGAPLLLGLVNATTEWVFAYEDRISVTISGADRLTDTPREALAALIWNEVARALRLEGPPPPWQIVKEKRATFAATPEQNARRPGAASPLANLVLAGDWTRTGLPATIEGAIRSGEKAARVLARERRRG
jgi:squalene-associated FAD-dependent desaturase